MSTSYPGALDSFVNPTATDTLDSATVPHAAQHDNINDAMSAVQVTLGVNPQGGSATVVARLTALDSTVAGKAATNQTMYVGTTAIAINRSSASQTLTGVSINGNAATATSATTATTVTNGVYTTDTGTVTSTMILDGTIVNADINASAAIADTKLATISTAGKVSGTAITSGNINTSGNITSSGTVIGATMGTDAVLMTGSGLQIFDAANSTKGTLFYSSTGDSNINLPASSGTLIATSDVGTVTSTMIKDGTIVNGDINASAAIADTKLAQITTASKVSGSAITGTISSGTWQGTAITPTYGGTGHTYGSPLVGKAMLDQNYTKPTNNTTPEAIFRNSSGTVQYFNVDADTTYVFDGVIGISTISSATANALRMSLIYVATGSTSTLTEQTAVFRHGAFTTQTTYITQAIGTAANTNIDNTFTSTLGSNFHIVFRGFIRTNATTAGRINIGAAQTVTGTSAPVFLSGSHINVYKMGTGLTTTFGNWS